MIRIFSESEETIFKEKTVVAIGNFDGVHLGHQKLLHVLKNKANNENLKSVVYTFSQNTKPGTKQITSLESRLSLIEDIGVDYTYIQDFNMEFAELSPLEFIKTILKEKLNCKALIVGFNFKFGKDASGDVNFLKKTLKDYGIELILIDRIIIDGVTVSSTLIRNLIINGEIKLIKKYLGRNFELSGEVIKGRQVGRQMGYPTANISIDGDRTVLPFGVYFTKTIINNNEFYGLTNVGINPTFHLTRLSIENHILDFDKNIYGEIINIEFLDKIRDEVKFNNINELKNQLLKDSEFVKASIKSITLQTRGDMI